MGTAVLLLRTIKARHYVLFLNVFLFNLGFPIESTDTGVILARY